MPCPKSIHSNLLKPTFDLLSGMHHHQRTPEEITGRKIVEEMFDDITELKDQGHTFESISEILKTVNVELSTSTLAGYYRDEIKERKV